MPVYHVPLGITVAPGQHPKHKTPVQPADMVPHLGSDPRIVVVRVQQAIIVLQVAPRLLPSLVPLEDTHPQLVVLMYPHVLCVLPEGMGPVLVGPAPHVLEHALLDIGVRMVAPLQPRMLVQQEDMVLLAHLTLLVVVFVTLGMCVLKRLRHHVPCHVLLVPIRLSLVRPQQQHVPHVRRGITVLLELQHPPNVVL